MFDPSAMWNISDWPPSGLIRHTSYLTVPDSVLMRIRQGDQISSPVVLLVLIVAICMQALTVRENLWTLLILREFGTENRSLPTKFRNFAELIWNLWFSLQTSENLFEQFKIYLSSWKKCKNVKVNSGNRRFFILFKSHALKIRNCYNPQGAYRQLMETEIKSSSVRITQVAVPSKRYL